MDRVHVGYLLIFILVVLGSLFAAYFVMEFREQRRGRRKRSEARDQETQVAIDRENAFKDTYGP